MANTSGTRTADEPAPAPPQGPRRSIKLGSYSEDARLIRIHPALDQADRTVEPLGDDGLHVTVGVDANDAIVVEARLQQSPFGVDGVSRGAQVMKQITSIGFTDATFAPKPAHAAWLELVGRPVVR